MIIDSHVHVKGGDNYRRCFPAEQIVAAMDRAGIDLSIVFAICLPAREANALTKQEIAKYPDRLIGYAYALPAYDYPVIDELRRAITQDAFRGIKLHGGECRIELSMVKPVLDLAAELDVPCIVDSGDVGTAQQVARACPQTKCILAHLGGLGLSEMGIDAAIALAAEYPNIYLDTAYVPKPWKISDAIEKAGAEKIIWGSDGPLIDPALELQKVKILGLPPEKEALVLGGNIARLIGLTQNTKG